MKKRFLSLLLVLSFVVSLVPGVAISASAAEGNTVNYTVNHVKHNQDGTSTTDPEILSGEVGEQSAAVAKTYEGYTAALIQQITLSANVEGNVVTVDYYQCHYIATESSLTLLPGAKSTTLIDVTDGQYGASFKKGGYYEFIEYVPETAIYTFAFFVHSNPDSPERNVKIISETSSKDRSSGKVHIPGKQGKAGFSEYTANIVLFKGYNTVRIQNSKESELFVDHINEIKTTDGSLTYFEDKLVFHNKGQEDTTQSTYRVAHTGSITFETETFEGYISKHSQNATLTSNPSENVVTTNYFSTNDICAVLSENNSSIISPKSITVKTGDGEVYESFVVIYRDKTGTINAYVEDQVDYLVKFKAYNSFESYYDYNTVAVEYKNLDTKETITKNYEVKGNESTPCDIEDVVSMKPGYYEITIKPIDSHVIISGSLNIIGCSTDKPLVKYTVKQFLDEKKILSSDHFQNVGTTTTAAASGYSESGQYSFFKNYVLKESGNQDIDINYYKDGFLSFVVNGSKINVTNANNNLYLLLPSNTGLNNVSVTSIKNGTLTVDGNQHSLTANTPCEGIDISSAKSITFTSTDLGFEGSSITVKSSNTIDSIYFTLKGYLHTITKDDSTATTGTMSMISSDGSLVNFGTESEPKTSISVNEFLKRGSTSYTYADGKYPFKFKLDEKVALVQNNEGKDVKGKSWVLLYNSSQELSGLSITAGFDLYQALDGDGAVSYKFVNVYVDGNYRGVYILAEKSTAEAKKKVTLSDDPVLSEDATYKEGTTENKATYKYCENAPSAGSTGFIVEMNTSVQEKCYIKTSRGYFYNIKDPNYPTNEQMHSFATYIQDFEDALFSESGYNTSGKHYSEYVDLDSLAKLFVVKSYLTDTDFFAASTFFAVDINEDGSYKKMISANVWDTSSAYNLNKVFRLCHWNTNAKNLQLEFLKKGDLVKKIYDLLPRFNGDNGIIGRENNKLNSMLIELSAAYNLDDVIYGRDLNAKASATVSAITNHKGQWETLWNDTTNALRGVTVTSNNGTLTANAIGASTYQWYKLSDGYTTGTVISGANDAIYTPKDNSLYYVAVTGTGLPDANVTKMISNSVSAYAAMIGETKYDTLTNAINEANDGETITLLNNVTENIEIPAGKTVTINLNGHGLTAASGKTIDNKGTLTITGTGTVSGKIATVGTLTLGDDVTFTGAMAVTSGSNTNAKVAKLTIDGAVTYKATSGKIELSGTKFTLPASNEITVTSANKFTFKLTPESALEFGLSDKFTIPANTELTFGNEAKDVVKFNKEVTTTTNNMDFLSVPASTEVTVNNGETKTLEAAGSACTYSGDIVVLNDIKVPAGSVVYQSDADLVTMKADLKSALQDRYRVADFDKCVQYADVERIIQSGSSKVGVSMPYPNGTNDKTTFYVVHLKSDDSFEFPEVSKDEINDRISFEIDGTSPIMVGWVNNAESGKNIIIDEIPTKDTYYTLQAGSSVTYNVDPTQAEARIFLTAAPGVKLVTFNYDNADDITTGITRRVVYGVAAGSQLPSEPDIRTKTVVSGDKTDSYYFKGWEPSTNLTPAVTDEIYDNATYNAKWEILDITVTLTPSKSEIKVGGGVLVNVTVKDSKQPTWNDAKINIDYDKEKFTWSNSNDPDVTEADGKITILVKGEAKVSGEVLKTLSFVAKETTGELSTPNFTVDDVSTVDTTASAAVVNVTQVAHLNDATVKVTAADADTYTVTLGNGLDYAKDAKTGLDITTVVKGGAGFGGSIEDYDAGYTYTFTANDTPIDTSKVPIKADGTFVIANDVFTQNTVIKVSKAITGLDEKDIAIFSDFVAGYSLVLVDSSNDLKAKNLAYKGQDLFVVKQDEYDALIAKKLDREKAAIGTDVYAYIVKGEITQEAFLEGLTVSQAEKDILNDSAAGVYDVNLTGKVDLNDVQAAYDCYNVKHTMTRQNMAMYIRADVNNSGVVDAADVNAVFVEYRAPK